MSSSDVQDYLSARKHIEALAERPDYEGAAKRAWASAANDLNSTFDHFLLELVQNADDNKYDVKEPTLTLEFTAGQQLKTYCNELGFTKEDVTGISNLYASTKTGSQATTGEKGIGFKSVLGVAKVAWIISNVFRFKLYADPEKAMKPDWFNGPFPDQINTPSEGTSMYFELGPENSQHVREAIARFDPSIMLFLKKLRRIHLIIDGQPDTHLVREETVLTDGTSNVTLARNNIPVLQYKQFTYPFETHIKRKTGRENKKSQIKFGLPVSDDFQTIIQRDEKVYACLPINAFGFKFAIHADFDLSESREQIHGNSQWNRAIRDAICDNFAYAMEHLNKADSNLCYTWPRLLIASSNHDDFFRVLMPEILKKLRTLPVLRLEGGDRVKSDHSYLAYFPEKWRFEPDKRLPIPRSDTFPYLSAKYDVKCTELITDLGVREMPAYRIRDDLNTQADEVTKQDPEWHANLAKMAIKDHFLTEYYLSEVKIIPVSSSLGGDVSWVSASSNKQNLFLTLGYEGGMRTLPQGIGLLFIPDEASRNEDRLKLFVKLGARYVTREIGNIAHRIKKEHTDFDPDKSKKWTTEELVSHVHFLFKHQDAPSLSKLWVAVESGPPQLASEVFAKPITFKNRPLQVPVIHSAYLSGLSKDEKGRLLEWMVKTFRMPDGPRLASSKGESLVLSPEMKFIAETYDSSHFLDILRQRHKSYAHQLVKGLPEFQETLWTDIATMTVRYADPSDPARKRELSVALRDSVAPTFDAKKLQDKVPLPLLPIPTYNQQEWAFLELFGVQLEPDYTHWLTCLRKVKLDADEDESATSKWALSKFETILIIYYNLYKACQPPQEKANILNEIKKAFTDEPLIFIPSILTTNQKPTWAKPDDCVWYSPQGLDLRCTFSLERVHQYYRHQYFLRSVLQIEKAPDLGHLQREVEQLSTSPDLNSHLTLNYIARLFEEMDRLIPRRHHDVDDASRVYGELSRCAMIPISLPGSLKLVDKLVSVADDQEWFIGDRQILFESFHYHAPLLALGAAQVERCQMLLSFLGLDDRKLSRTALAVSTTKTFQETQHAKRWTVWAEYVDRIAWSASYFQRPSVSPMRKTRITVLSSDVFSVRWELQGTQAKYYSGVIPRIALAFLKDDEFTIYGQKGHLRSDLALMDLADDICDIWHIVKERQLILRHVIGIDNALDVENVLERKGIPKLPKQSLAARILRPWSHLLGSKSTASQDTNAAEHVKRIETAEQGKKTETAEQVKNEQPGGAGLEMPQPASTNPADSLAPSGESSSKVQPETSEKGPKKMTPNGKKQDKTGIDKNKNTGGTKLTATDIQHEHVPMKEAQVTPQQGGMNGTIKNRDEHALIKTTPDDVTSKHKGEEEVTGMDLGEVPEQPTKGEKKATAPTIENQTARPPSPPAVTITSHIATRQSQDDITLKSEQVRGRSSLQLPIREARAQSVGADSARKQKKAQEPRETPRWDHAPPSDADVITESAQPAFVPQTETGFTNMRLGTAYYPAMQMTFAGDDANDSTYYGELYVSRFLTSFFKSKCYDMDSHWTSPLRTRHGLGPLPPQISPDSATFTIPESGGELRDYVIKGCSIDSSWIAEKCTFHIVVCVTQTGLHSSFHLTYKQRIKAESMRLFKNGHAKDVCILARVYNVRTDPAIALFVDPWRLQEGGQITMEPAYSYELKVASAASALLIENCANIAPPSAELDAMYHGLEIDEWHIRLLELDLSDDATAGDNMTLRVKLVRRSVSPPSRFWAISYVWGDAPTKTAPRVEVVNEKNGKKVSVLVTDSLWSCLQCLRRKRVTAPLWADAICINQEDNVEKAIQVRRMGSLYSKAERVIIWTGNDHGTGGRALRWLPTLGQHPEEPPSVFVEKVKDSLELGAGLVDAFLQRKWFGRTWTIQELIFGSKVSILSGDSEMEWDFFMSCVVRCEELMQEAFGNGDELSQQKRFLTYSEAALALHHTRQHYRTSSPGDAKTHERRYSFLKLVELFYYTKSSIPCDKLFALLNMAHDTPIREDAFLPDYKSEPSVVLARYAERFVKAGKALRLLYRAGVGKGARFCSWIPDLMNERERDRYAPTIATWDAVSLPGIPAWTIHADNNDEDDDKVHISRGFCAGDWSKSEARVLSPEDTGWSTSVGGTRVPVLAITGRLFDAVKTRESLRLSLSGTSIPFSQTLAVFQQTVLPLRFYPSLGSDWVDELTVKCLTGNAAAPQSAVPPLPSMAAMRARGKASDSSVVISSQPQRRWSKGFERHVLDVHPGQDGREYARRPAEARNAVAQFWMTVSAFMQRIPEPAVCTTDKGYAGIFPGEAEVGDRIFLPRGSKVPFVIRMYKGQTGGKKHYQLIGECYVHGIMYNEDDSVKKLGDEVVYIV